MNPVTIGDATLNGDCRDVLKTLPDESVHCCVTSPPYWGLRDYGHRGQIGLEPTAEAYVAELVAVFREVRRVLRSDGVCWLNLGDTYNGGGLGGGKEKGQLGGSSNRERQGDSRATIRLPNLKPKDLVGIPWRVAFALQADGWWLRSDIIWNKPNCMPSSVTDRPTTAHEYVFLLAKSERYWYDAEAVKEASSEDSGYAKQRAKGMDTWQYGRAAGGDPYSRNGIGGTAGIADTRNRRSVWTVATQPYSGAHFATFPPALIEPMILAGCPAQACPTCGKGWERVAEITKSWRETAYEDNGKQTYRTGSGNQTVRPSCGGMSKSESRTLGHRPACACPPADPVPGVVLDPFGGSGTTGQVASRLGRRAILIELNPEYRALSDRRTAQGGLMLQARA